MNDPLLIVLAALGGFVGGLLAGWWRDRRRARKKRWTRP